MTTDELLAFVDRCRGSHMDERYDLAMRLAEAQARFAMDAVHRVLSQQREELDDDRAHDPVR